VNRIMQTMRWFREVSVLAEDEQRRSGHPEIDVEHLFLALVSVGGSVTDSLAKRGVTLDAARAAFEHIHARHLSSIGVAASGLHDADRRIPDGSARGGYAYRHGVRRMLEEASAAPVPDVALFRALLDEPSGHAREALRELRVDPDALDLAATPQPQPHARSDQAGEYRRFIASAPDTVWALVSDPDRWLEWNDFEFEKAETTSSGVMRAYVRERRLDGKPTRARPGFRVSEFVVSRFEPHRLIEWERSFPDADTTGPQTLRLTLSPRSSGTELTITFMRSRPTGGRRRVMHGLLRPLARLLRPFVVRAHLRGKADNISRALR
jgi:uncharacterized protein YndB with AHSA1/START domain